MNRCANLRDLLAPVAPLLLIVMAHALAHAGVAQAQALGSCWNIPVDYTVAVAPGGIVDPSDYNELVEFSDAVSRRVDDLPATEASAGLSSQARALQASIGGTAAPQLVATPARRSAAALLFADPVPVKPNGPPDADRGARLASIHPREDDQRPITKVGLVRVEPTFIVAYRAVFETNLTVAAIWDEGSKLAVLAGAATRLPCWPVSQGRCCGSAGRCRSARSSP